MKEPVRSRLPETEAIAEAADLDRLSPGALVATLIEAQRDIADLVYAQREAIADVVEEIARRLQRGGHLHYVGAGTSGRLATLDAAEIPPTFGVEPDLVHAHVAGGASALVRAVEGAEDDAAAGEAALGDVDATDAVVGISASGGAPFVVGALGAARKRGAFTVAIVNGDGSPLGRVAERCIVVHTGAEPIAGSTRMRAGTGQKIVLNTISTATMVLLGKVYENLMVDLVATSRKLHARAVRLVCRLADVEEVRAAALLDAAGGSVKCAVVMQRRNVRADEARALLDRHAGRLRELL